jgi:hypothetical protein
MPEGILTRGAGTMTDQQTISELRAALARIAGMTGEDARRATTGVLASILGDINETAEAALDRTSAEAIG